MLETTKQFTPWHSAEEIPAPNESCVVYYSYRYGMYRGTGYAKAEYTGDGWNLPADWRVVSWGYLSLADFSNLREKPKKRKRAGGRAKRPGGVWFHDGQAPLK